MSSDASRNQSTLATLIQTNPDIPLYWPNLEVSKVIVKEVDISQVIFLKFIKLIYGDFGQIILCTGAF